MSEQETIESDSGETNFLDSLEDEPVDEEQIEEFVEGLVEADELYEKADSEKAVNNKKEDNAGYIKKCKFALKFLRKSIYYTPDIPTKGEVKNVEVEDESISIVVRVPYPEIPGENVDEDYMKESFKFDPQSTEDKENVDFLLKKAGVEKPSKLVGKSVPIVNGSDSSYYTSDPIFKIPNKPKTIANKASYIGYQVALKSKMIDRRSTDFGDIDARGDWLPNRNLFLISSILFGLLSVPLIYIVNIISFSIIFYLPGVTSVALALMCIGIYICIVGQSLVKALGEVIFKEPDKREYIKSFVEK